MKLLIANWKLYLTSARDAVKLARESDHKNVVICPPFPFLGIVQKTVKKARLGAQDVFREDPKKGGAFTGEVSASMLKGMGVRYVLVGHSERRKWFNETDATINKKVTVSLSAGLKVILCVGEPLAIRKKGIAAAERFVRGQLQKDLKGLNPKSKILNSNLIVAYEPLWAISTSKTHTPDNPEDSARMAESIKEFLYSKFYMLNPKVLYGGSVTSKNIARIITQKEIDGALVGGASIKVAEFKPIIKKAL